MTAARTEWARLALAAAPKAPDLLFAAVADQRRRRMLAALAAGPLRVGELARRAELDPGLMTFHLGLLRRAGLVRWGRGEVAIHPEGLAPLRGYMDAILRVAAIHGDVSQVAA